MCGGAGGRGVGVGVWVWVWVCGGEGERGGGRGGGITVCCAVAFITEDTSRAAVDQEEVEWTGD